MHILKLRKLITLYLVKEGRLPKMPLMPEILRFVFIRFQIVVSTNTSPPIPKITLAAMTTGLEPGKTNLDLTHKFRKI